LIFLEVVLQNYLMFACFFCIDNFGLLSSNAMSGNHKRKFILAWTKMQQNMIKKQAAFWFKKTLLSSSLTKTPARRLSFGQYRGSELKLDLDLRIGQTKNVKVLVFMLTWKLFYLPVVWFYQQISFFEMKNRSCLNKGLSFASIFVKKKSLFQF